jgi:hypothetical protein
LRVGQDLERDEIDSWNFDTKALLIRAKIKLRFRISEFSSFIHYVLGLFALNTKIEGITKISLVNDHVISKFFVFDKKILKLWPQWVEISNNIGYKLRKFWNSKS